MNCSCWANRNTAESRCCSSWCFNCSCRCWDNSFACWSAIYVADTCHDYLKRNTLKDCIHNSTARVEVPKLPNICSTAPKCDLLSKGNRPNYAGFVKLHMKEEGLGLGLGLGLCEYSVQMWWMIYAPHREGWKAYMKCWVPCERPTWWCYWRGPILNHNEIPDLFNISRCCCTTLD